MQPKDAEKQMQRQADETEQLIERQQIELNSKWYVSMLVKSAHKIHSGGGRVLKMFMQFAIVWVDQYWLKECRPGLKRGLNHRLLTTFGL